MLLKLDDDALVPYQQIAEAQKQPLDLVLTRQLTRFAAYPPTVRVLPLPPDALQQVETLLGGGAISTPQQLVDRVRSYASITLGKITLDLTPAQKSEITHRAAKRGLPPDAIVKEIVGIVLDQMFDAVTPYR